MDSIPRIPYLGIEINKDSAKLLELRQLVENVKVQLSGHEDIFCRNFKGLKFASTDRETGKVYASFNVKRNALADYCRRMRIVAKVHPAMAIYEYLEEEAIRVGTEMHIPIIHDSDRYDFFKDIGDSRLKYLRNYKVKILLQFTTLLDLHFVSSCVYF